MNLSSLPRRASRALRPSRRRALALVLALAALAVSAQAGERRITIGEVSSKVTRSGINYESLLRSASEEELQALDLSHVPRGKRVIVSVALVRLDTLGDPRALDTTCEVSAAVREAQGGNMIAILSGKARGTSGAAPGSVESTLVHGAIHGALAHIPEVLER